LDVTFHGRMEELGRTIEGLQERALKLGPVKARRLAELEGTARGPASPSGNLQIRSHDPRHEVIEIPETD
jgi:hypothetical protein